MKKLDIARKKQVRVDNYLDYDLKFKTCKGHNFLRQGRQSSRSSIKTTFNLVVIEVFIFGFLLLLGNIQRLTCHFSFPPRQASLSS